MVASVGADTGQSQVQPVTASTLPSTHGGFNFHDILEVINPLQHIPVIGTVYRELTGDTISPAARIAGDALYGGVWGLASSVVNELVEGETGKDIGGHIWATLFGDDAPTETATTATPSSAPVASTDASSSTAGLPASATPVPTTPPPAVAPPQSAAIQTPPSQTSPSQASDFYQKMQHASHGSRAVPLNATVPIGATHAPVAVGRSSDGPNASAPSASAPVPIPQGAASAPVTPPAVLPTVSNTLPTPAPVAAPAIPPANIAELMNKALDKYKSMAQQQNPTGLSPTALID